MLLSAYSLCVLSLCSRIPQQRNSKNPQKISNMPNKEFKEIVTRMLTKLESGIWELMENFNKNIIKNQADLKNIITKMKTT